MPARYWGLLASAEGDAEEYLRQQKAIASLLPNDAATQADLASALELSGDVRAAEDAFQRAIALAPGAALYHHRLGNLLQKQKRHEVALASLRKAASLDPALDNIWFAIGDFELALGHLPEARKAYETYLRDQPGGSFAAIAQLRLKSVSSAMTRLASFALLCLLSLPVVAQSLDELPPDVAAVAQDAVEQCNRIGGKPDFEPLELVKFLTLGIRDAYVIDTRALRCKGG